MCCTLGKRKHSKENGRNNWRECDFGVWKSKHERRLQRWIEANPQHIIRSLFWQPTTNRRYLPRLNSLAISLFHVGNNLLRIMWWNSIRITPSILEHPISEELNDSINCKVAKLELDNEALQREVQEANQKLSDAQMELARLKVIMSLKSKVNWKVIFGWVRRNFICT